MFGVYWIAVPWSVNVNDSFFFFNFGRFRPKINQWRLPMLFLFLSPTKNKICIHVQYPNVFNAAKNKLFSYSWQSRENQKLKIWRLLVVRLATDVILTTTNIIIYIRIKVYMYITDTDNKNSYSDNKFFESHNMITLLKLFHHI